MRVENRTQTEIDVLTVELLAALRSYRAAKAIHASRTESLDRMHGDDTAGAFVAKRDDRRRIEAGQNVAWFQAEIAAASNAILALRPAAGSWIEQPFTVTRGESTQ